MIYSDIYCRARGDNVLLQRSIGNRMKFHKKKREASPLYRRVRTLGDARRAR